MASNGGVDVVLLMGLCAGGGGASATCCCFGLCNDNVLVALCAGGGCFSGVTCNCIDFVVVVGVVFVVSVDAVVGVNVNDCFCNVGKRG